MRSRAVFSYSFILVFVVAILPGLIAKKAIASEQIYWSSAGQNNQPEITAMNSDGSGVHAVLPSVHNTSVQSISVDPQDGTIFYGRFAPDYTINRINNNGSGKQVLYDLNSLQQFEPQVGGNNTPFPIGLALDSLHDKLYWIGANPIAGDPGDVTFIQRSNLDGTQVETIMQTPYTASSPRDIKVDPAAGKIYWTDNSNNTIRCSNLDGTGMQTLLTTANSPAGIAIDPQHQRMFWSEMPVGHRSEIFTANLDGSGVQIILSSTIAPTFVSNYDQISDLAVDPATSTLYIPDDAGGGVGSILRCNYDGSGQQILNSNAAGAEGIAVVNIVPEPSSILLALLGGVCLLPRLKKHRRD
jgi:hypothetical protein